MGSSRGLRAAPAAPAFGQRREREQALCFPVPRLRPDQQRNRARTHLTSESLAGRGSVMHEAARNEAGLSGLEARSMTWTGQLLHAR